MYVEINKNIDIIKIMILYKHIINLVIIFVWKKIVLIRNLLHLKQLINLKYIECKHIKKIVKK